MPRADGVIFDYEEKQILKTIVRKLFPEGDDITAFAEQNGLDDEVMASVVSFIDYEL